jgi:hypothetical protein
MAEFSEIITNSTQQELSVFWVLSGLTTVAGGEAEALVSWGRFARRLPKDS